MGGRNINVVIARDISERKKAERDLLELTQVLERRVTDRTAELSASEARFRDAFETAAQGMTLVSLDGRFIQVNEALCQMVGYSDAALQATTL